MSEPRERTWIEKEGKGESERLRRRKMYHWVRTKTPVCTSLALIAHFGVAEGEGGGEGEAGDRAEGQEGGGEEEGSGGEGEEGGGG